MNHKKIIVADVENYVGQFVLHHLYSVVDDKENISDINQPESTGSRRDMLIWSSLNPTGQRAMEIGQMLDSNFPPVVVMLSSCSIYGVGEGTNINELSSFDTTSGVCEAEKMMAELCMANNSVLSILRLPLWVVGTGMGDPLMTIVGQIYRGTYYNIKGVDAPVSLIHASSVGPAILAVAGLSAIFNINDGTETTMSQFIDALSYRIGHKRPFSFPLSIARRIAAVADFIGVKSHGRKMLDMKTKPLTFSAQQFFSATGYCPDSTVQYLKTHVYDENSL